MNSRSGIDRRKNGKRWGLTRTLDQNLGKKDGFESNDRTIERKKNGGLNEWQIRNGFKKERKKIGVETNGVLE